MAGEFLDGGHDERPDARDRRSDDDHGVFHVAPADELNAAGGTEICDAGELVQFCCFHDRCYHGPGNR